MPDTDQLQFEMQRRVILFNSGTTMPDKSVLGYEGNPNYVSTGTAGQTLLYNSPRGTNYIELVNGNLWYKQLMPNTWISLTSGSGSFSPSQNNVVFITGNQDISGVKNFYSRPTVNGSGILLVGESGSVVLPNTIVYTTGNQDISGVKNFYSRLTVNGIGVLLSGEITPGGLPTTIVYTTGNQTISGIKTFDVAPILSGNPFITGVNLSSYVTTGQTGVFYPRDNPSGFITDVNLSSYVTTGQTGVFYPRDNPSGFISSADFSRVVYTTGDQTISGVKTFASRPTVNGTGVLLSGEAANVTLPATIVYTTGNQTISGIKTFDVAPILSGNPFITGVNLSSYVTTGQTGVFYPRDNPSGFITDVNLSSYVTTGQTGVFYPRNNPSGFITGVDVSSYVTTGQTGVFYPRDNPSGFITGVNLSSYVTTGQTGVFYPRNNPSGFISSADLSGFALGNQVVYTTGDQNIFGNKTFLNNIAVSGTGIFQDINIFNLNELVVSGARIIIAGDSGVYSYANIYISGNPVLTGVNLSSYVTTGQTGVFYPRDNPSGFITGIDVSSYVTTGQTGVFYPRNNPSGFITGVDVSSYVTTGQTGVFYPRDNPSGFISTADLTSYALANQVVYKTGDQNISGGKTFVNNLAVQGTGIFNALDLSNISTFDFSGTNINLINGNVNISGGTLYISGNPVLTGVIPTAQTITNVVYTTGDQTISGVKGFASRPTVNGTGVLLIGEAAGGGGQDIVYTTGDQNISGLKNFSTIPTVNGTGFLLAGSTIPSNEASGAGGSIFITYVSPSGGIGNVGDYVYETPGQDRGNTALLSCSTTTQNVLVDIYALQGRSRFKPKLYISGQEIPSSLVVRNDDRPVFLVNSFGINLNNATSLRVDHEDGAYHAISITQDTPPQVTGAYFYGGYPSIPTGGYQTELKAGDTFNFHIDTDVPIISIEIDNSGAFNAATISVTAGTSHNLTSRQIANRGDTTQALGARVRVQKANGSYSAWFLTTSQGSTDGQYTVKLNNIGPTISFGTITYPGTQGALKNTESATVVNNVSDYDTISYTSSELDIDSSTLYESPKIVTRNDGTQYNASSPNLTITAIRTANNKSASNSVLVKIANGTFNLNVSTNGGVRLRTGGNDGTSTPSYTVTITATQQLLSAPTLIVPGGGGTLGSFGGGPTSWSATLSNINDDLIKGTKNWGAISAINIAGTTGTTINSGGSYVIGGFVSRSLTLAAFQNTLTLNTSVSDFSKMTLSWPFKPSVTTRSEIGTEPPLANSWTINSVGVNPTTVIILDTSATQSSSQATSVTVAENI
jgi:hypothetical protein